MREGASFDPYRTNGGFHRSLSGNLAPSMLRLLLGGTGAFLSHEGDFGDVADSFPSGVSFIVGGPRGFAPYVFETRKLRNFALLGWDRHPFLCIIGELSAPTFTYGFSITLHFWEYNDSKLFAFCAFPNNARDVREAADTAGRDDFWTVAIRGSQQFASVVIAYMQVACDDGWLKGAVRRTFYKVPSRSVRSMWFLFLNGPA